MEKYLKRLIEKTIHEKIKTTGAILIQGPKACGKTTTSRIFAKSEITLDDAIQLKIHAENNPDFVLEGLKPRFIDEWQCLPWIKNKVRHKVDDAGVVNGKGMYILSGSSSIPNDQNSHTGAMRIATIDMKTMSLQESKHSSEEVNFRNLFNDKPIKVKGISKYNRHDSIDHVLSGGWPILLNLPPNIASQEVYSYIQVLSEKEFKNANIKISKNRMFSLINSISRNIGTSANLETLAKESEIYANNKNALSTKTTRKYLDLLTQVFILDELQSWRIKLRSSIRTKVKSKWYFVDPSIAAASMVYSKDKLENDWETFGFLFESLVIRDLRIYANYLNAKVYYYGDNTKLDIDAIVEFPNREWAAFEIKLGGPTGIKLGKENFKLFKNRLTPDRLKTCKSWNIITSENISYTDEDGINIISIGHLFVE